MRKPKASVRAVRAAEKELGISMARLRRIDRELAVVVDIAEEWGHLDLASKAAMAALGAMHVADYLRAVAEEHSYADVAAEVAAELARESGAIDTTKSAICGEGA